MESMEALKQRLSALKANAAADGGTNNIVKVTAAVIDASKLTPCFSS